MQPPRGEIRGGGGGYTQLMALLCGIPHATALHSLYSLAGRLRHVQSCMNSLMVLLLAADGARNVLILSMIVQVQKKDQTSWHV